MKTLAQEIIEDLGKARICGRTEGHGFSGSAGSGAPWKSADGADDCGVQSILCRHAVSGKNVRILPVEIIRSSREEAKLRQEILCGAIERFREADGSYPMIVSRDRWERKRKMMYDRILAHLGVYTQIYARNCEVRRIDKPTAAAFLENAHSYGDASCKYRYGLFIKRHTGHILSEGHTENLVAPGTLVAVSEFSGARRWKKGDITVSSYEWVRYASLPSLRISGGMGKMLKYFISMVHPDDIMSYADLEWSEGAVYERLGFVCEGQKAPVEFTFDETTWKRKPSADGADHDRKAAQDETIGTIKADVPPFKGNDRTSYVAEDGQMLRMVNFGSLKYRLKLTDYR